MSAMAMVEEDLYSLLPHVRGAGDDDPEDEDIDDDDLDDDDDDDEDDEDDDLDDPLIDLDDEYDTDPAERHKHPGHPHRFQD